MTVLAENPTETAASPAPTASSGLHAYFLGLTAGAPEPWNATTIGGLVSLVLIWAAWFYGTWATWGYLTADCGREMYVPLVLSEGKTLYKDIWYLYGPAAPYFNSFLYRLFGVHLTVLYWGGSLAALGSAIFLYLAGMRLSSWLVGWTAGAVLLTQSFHHSLFSFPLPYSFASVYGCLTACVFLWLILCAATSDRLAWMFAAGTAAAVALLLKLEIGAACYAALALLIAVRWLRERSWKAAAQDIAVCLPGVVLCGAVLSWMISLGGVEFITQENIMSWPTSFFMRTYGKFWLATTGLSFTAEAFGKAALRTVIFLGVFQGIHLLVSRSRQHANRRNTLLRWALFLGAVVYLVVYLRADEVLRYNTIALTFQDALRYLFFPQDMVLYIGIIALFAWWYFWKNAADRQSAAIALTLTFAALLAARSLLNTTPMSYPIFYNGPAVLCFLLLARHALQQAGGAQRPTQIAQAVLCGLCLTAALANIHRQLETPFRPTAWLSTERGSIHVSEHLAEQYAAAIRFMKDQNALGNQVMSIPEDTSLYFLSGTHSPTRVFAFTPGLLAPGKMTQEVIQQIEAQPVRFLIWSNRTFPEYKAMRFGIDSDSTLYNYLTSHYHRVRILVDNPVPFGEWNAYIWERNSRAEAR
jgi:hypothetical protein